MRKLQEQSRQVSSAFSRATEDLTETVSELKEPLNKLKINDK